MRRTLLFTLWVALSAAISLEEHCEKLKDKQGQTRTAAEVKEQMDMAMGWCLEDAECAVLYGQVPTQNDTLFTFLLNHHWAGMNHDRDHVGASKYADVTWPLFHWICPWIHDPDQLTQSMMLLHLELMERRGLPCAPNEMPVFSDRDHRHCACRPDRSCHPEARNHNTVIVLLIILICLVLLLLYRNVQFYQAFLAKSS